MSQKVSVIIPCYNVEIFIDDCLNSIVGQTYDNLEIIVVNDGSTDSTLEKIRKFKEKDTRLILVDQKNTGLSEARNKAIDLTTGKYIIFVDSDDWIDLNYVEKLVELSFGVDLTVASYYKEFRIKTEIRKLNLQGNYSAELIQRRITGLIDDELADPTQADSMVTVWAKLYTTSIIRSNQIKFCSTNEIGTAEDLLFNLQYLEFCESVNVVDAPMYHYRKFNSGSFTSLHRENLFLKWSNLFRKIQDITSDKNPAFDAAILNRISLSLIGLGLNEISSDESLIRQYSNLKYFINHHLYINAYATLKLEYFPIHWKVFFYMAKKRHALGIFVMLFAIRILMNKKNN